MTQGEFEARYGADWTALETALDPKARVAPADFPRLYRQACAHLALARERAYSPSLVERLNRLVLAGHQALYGALREEGRGVARTLLGDFPRELRRGWLALLLSCALFLLPAALSALAVLSSDDAVYMLLDPHQVASMEEMYRPDAPHIGRERDSDDDFAMFGFYIKNNIGIAFQTFAAGIAAGVGSAVYLVINGVLLGAVAAHLSAVGHGGQFWPFVIGHGALELTAIVIAGAAGLRLGGALLSPGRLSRAESLKQVARRLLPVVYGMSAMLLGAAFIEAFWSSSAILTAPIKYAAGGGLWLAVLAFLAFGGRGGT